MAQTRVGLNRPRHLRSKKVGTAAFFTDFDLHLAQSKFCSSTVDFIIVALLGLCKGFLEIFQLFEERFCRCVGRHAEVAARRERHRADLRAVGQTGALKLLCKEAAHKHAEPAENCLSVVFAREGVAREAENLRRAAAHAHHVVEEEIVQFIGTDNLLGHL